MEGSKDSVKVMIAEDDPHIGVGLEELLNQEGYSVQRVQRGDEVLDKVSRFHPELLVLDIMLPEMDGFTICRELRSQGSAIPILMLTAKGEELDKVRGLELGADDYLTKPFGVRELLARVKALLRRSQQDQGSPNDTMAQDTTFSIGNALINSETYELNLSGKVETLSPKEVNLLICFHRHRGKVLSRDFLLNEVWGLNYMGNTRTLDQVIVKLRRLIGEPDGKPKHILTVHGAGYKLAHNPC